MQQFRINPEGYNNFKKRWLRIMIPALVAILLLIILAYGVFASQPDYTVVGILLFVFVIYAGFDIRRTLKRVKKMYGSYSLTLTDTGITRTQADVPPLTIDFAGITDIWQTKKGFYCIRGRNRTDIISIPKTIENADQLIQQLQSFTPAQIRDRQTWQYRFRWLIAGALIAACVGFMIAPNPVVSGCCGILMIAFLCWRFYAIQISKSVSVSRKRRSWFTILVIAVVVYATYLKFAEAHPIY